MSFSTCPEYGYDPHSKGRWYRIKLVSTGTTLSMPQCDIHDSQVTNSGVLLPSHFVAMDLITDVESKSWTGSGTASYPSFYVGGSGQVSIAFNNIKWFSECYLYVFGYCKP